MVSSSFTCHFGYLGEEIMVSGISFIVLIVEFKYLIFMHNLKEESSKEHCKINKNGTCEGLCDLF